MGLRIKRYIPAKLYPVDDAYPEEVDYIVISDISGDDITDKDLYLVDGQVCSKDEMLEIFCDEYVSEITDEKEYQEVKDFLINFLDYNESDFDKHPKIIKINMPFDRDHDYCYELADDLKYSIRDYLPDDFYHVDIWDLEVEDY